MNHVCKTNRTESTVRSKLYKTEEAAFALNIIGSCGSRISEVAKYRKQKERKKERKEGVVNVACFFTSNKHQVYIS